MKFKFLPKKIQAKNIGTQMTAKIQKEVLEIENLKQDECVMVFGAPQMENDPLPD